VHDVGDYQRILEPGDVITIEPGLYLPDEQIGIRIEDNYWIVPNGSVCLSEELPRTADEIEKLISEARK
jgi:Xaa-Pro aminopeptidase